MRLIYAAIRMPTLGPAISRWVLGAVGKDGCIAETRGLREGGSPWMLRIVGEDAERSVVLRVADASVRPGVRTEVAALGFAVAHDIKVPALIAADVGGDPPLVLTETVIGSSTIPTQVSRSRLRRLGALAASIHDAPPPLHPDLPARERPLQGVDFAALRRHCPRDALAARGEALAAARRPSRWAEGFVHGDLWQGNVLWHNDTITAVVDWDSAGRGPAGLDLGSLRLDAALCFGIDAADDVLNGWQDHAGRPAEDVAYWDLIAALSTPPDMDWFPPTFVDQSRPDLTAEVLITQRDQFLAVAIDILDRR
jgi:aminoglycoside phosphotransferase (APT) family kinase protein